MKVRFRQAYVYVWNPVWNFDNQDLFYSYAKQLNNYSNKTNIHKVITNDTKDVHNCRHYCATMKELASKQVVKEHCNLLFWILSSVLEGGFFTLVVLDCWVLYRPEGRSVLKNNISLALVRGAITGLQLQQFQGLIKREGPRQQMQERGPNSSVFKENEKLANSHNIFVVL